MVMLNKILDSFWTWYNKHYLFALTATTLLFLLQAFHLYWLFTDVVLQKITGNSYFLAPSFWGSLSAILDYTEIPALISTSLVYINQLRQGGFKWRPVRFLVMLNIQWLHLFWITDEVVVERLSGQDVLLHWAAVVAWIAILIDYAELPVMYDTAKETIKEFRKETRSPRT
jgi:membrane protein CcdC involved in cytochrome C biogenesis